MCKIEHESVEFSTDFTACQPLPRKATHDEPVITMGVDSLTPEDKSKTKELFRTLSKTQPLELLPYSRLNAKRYGKNKTKKKDMSLQRARYLKMLKMEYIPQTDDIHPATNPYESKYNIIPMSLEAYGPLNPVNSLATSREWKQLLDRLQLFRTIMTSALSFIDNSTSYIEAIISAITDFYLNPSLPYLIKKLCDLFREFTGKSFLVDFSGKLVSFLQTSFETETSSPLVRNDQLVPHSLELLDFVTGIRTDKTQYGLKVLLDFIFVNKSYELVKYAFYLFLEESTIKEWTNSGGMTSEFLKLLLSKGPKIGKKDTLNMFTFLDKITDYSLWLLEQMLRRYHNLDNELFLAKFTLNTLINGYNKLVSVTIFDDERDIGPKVPGMVYMTQDEYILEYETWKDQSESLKIIYISENSHYASMVVSKMTAMHARFLQTMNKRSISNRKQPLAIMVEGPPSVGKTEVCKFIYDIWSTIMGYDEPDHNKLFIRNGDTDYWDGAPDDMRGIILDDLGQWAPRLNENGMYKEILRMINSQPYPLNYAAVEDKGKHYFNAGIVLGTTNVGARNVHQDLGAGHVFNCPAALARRFQYRIELRTRIAARTDPSGVVTPIAMINPQYCENGYLDSHDYKVTKVVMQDENNVSYVPMTNGQFVDRLTFIKIFEEINAEHERQHKVRAEGFDRRKARRATKCNNPACPAVLSFDCSMECRKGLPIIPTVPVEPTVGGQPVTLIDLDALDKQSSAAEGPEDDISGSAPGPYLSHIGGFGPEEDNLDSGFETAQTLKRKYYAFLWAHQNKDTGFTFNEQWTNKDLESIIDFDRAEHLKLYDEFIKLNQENIEAQSFEVSPEDWLKFIIIFAKAKYGSYQIWLGNFIINYDLSIS
jgi:hypothetical protein